MRIGRRISVFAWVVLVLALMLVALPGSAGATPPEQVSLRLVTAFDVTEGTMTGTGPWESAGLITSAGDATQFHFVAGWPHSSIFQTAHSTETLEDANGTITIQSQTRGYEWTFDGNDSYFAGSGRWVILSGTGDYAKLHGRGTVTVMGELTAASFPFMTVAQSYEGVAHFDP